MIKPTVGATAALMLVGVMSTNASGATPPRERAGEVHEITRVAETEEKGSDDSSSSSFDRDTIVERVLAVRSDGLELEYDLPDSATPQDRASNWQLPLRVFKPMAGPARLLDAAALEGRITAWLKAAKIDRAACGRHVFTWNVFKIECDPQAALATVAAFDLRPGVLRDGAVFNTPQVAAPVTLRTNGKSPPTFAGTASVDADRVRRDRAEADVVAAEIIGKTLSMADAQRKHASERITGTVSVAFTLDPAGGVKQRTITTRVDTVTTDGVASTRVATEVLSRRPLPDTAPTH